MVVLLDELVAERLQVVDRVGGGWAVSQRFNVWWKRSTLPQVVGWFGREFFWMMPKLSRRCSNWLRPPRPPERRVVNTIPLSVSVDAGTPWVCRAFVNTGRRRGR